jgi:hypothetical protein
LLDYKYCRDLNQLRRPHKNHAGLIANPLATERVMHARLAVISAAALATIAAAPEPTKPVAAPTQLTQPQ